ncbi:hypothetical protein HH304_20960 [Flammeovirgaceae bacterium KN852]|uniref:Transposase IS801/IS1294 domain-containing protein n=1 Tax=Marinigracilibium pacificum TaxID=2729599 RepID=A0A848J241_9BACT|nr:hypothetical protein [Marinigracilibium pacificum]
MEYLGRYTHKIAISNARILSYQNNEVCFVAKDYRKGGQKVVLRLTDREFIRRYALHVLPKGFTRMRHYGILSSSLKKQCKQIIDEQIGVVVIPLRQESIQHKLCLYCKSGHLVTVAVFG